MNHVNMGTMHVGDFIIQYQKQNCWLCYYSLKV